jgi:hypothetical protein
MLAFFFFTHLRVNIVLFLNYFKARDTYRILEGKRKERYYLEDVGLKERVILKWILKKVFFLFRD